MPPKKQTATPKKKPTTTPKKKPTVAKKKPQIYLDSSTDESSSGSDSEDEVSNKGRKITKKKLVVAKAPPRKPLPKPKPVAKKEKKKKVSKKMTVPSRRGKRSSRYSDSDSYSSGSDWSDSESDYSDFSDSEVDSEEEERYQKMQRELGYNPKQDEDYQGKGFRLPVKPAIFCLIGTQGSGKSHMIRYILYSYCGLRYFTGGGIVFSPTKFNGDYNFMPDKAVFDNYYEDILQRHIANLRRITEAGKKQHGQDWKPKPNFVVLDDCLGLIKDSAFFNNWIATGLCGRGWQQAAVGA